MKSLILSICLLSTILSQGQNYPTEITVAQDGSGDFTSIQSAINATKAFPDMPIKIFIKEGVYKEKVLVYSWNTNLSLIGDANGKTVISWEDHFKKIDLGRNSTFHTYTLKVEANDFYASNLTIENTAGDVGQAVAIHVEADRVFFENCQFLGYQDTMFLAGENDRIFFKNCLITGTTDFIFGSATALFEGCEIQSKKASYITAASTPQSVYFGFVFKNCKLTHENLEAGSVYLGRPWRGHAKTVFINCEMDSHIHPAGWKEWHTGGEVLYAEFGTKGLGASPSDRADWSIQLSEEQALTYSKDRVLSHWIPKN